MQNFRAKPGTRMAEHPGRDARGAPVVGRRGADRCSAPDWHVQAPPNLAYDDFPLLLDAGIDDWGGVSPVTIDHVNPEAPWPEIERLRDGDRVARARARAAAAALSRARRRPRALGRSGGAPAVRRASDALGLAREDRWAPGEPVEVPFLVRRDAIPLELAGDELGRGRARAAALGPRRRAGAGARRRRSAAARGLR